MGIPKVLVYLGFTGDEGMRTSGRTPFAADAHWQTISRQYRTGVCPVSVLDAPLDLPEAKLWVMSKSRPVSTVSTPGTGRVPAPSSARS